MNENKLALFLFFVVLELALWIPRKNPPSLSFFFLIWVSPPLERPRKASRLPLFKPAAQVTTKMKHEISGYQKKEKRKQDTRASSTTSQKKIQHLFSSSLHVSDGHLDVDAVLDRQRRQRLDDVDGRVQVDEPVF